MGWYIGIYIFLLLCGIYGFFVSTESDKAIGLCVGFIPIINIVCFIYLIAIYGEDSYTHDHIKKFFENFGYQGIDDETKKQLKDAKEDRNFAIEAAKQEYATKVSGLKKVAKKRNLLDKLDLTEGDLDELREMLRERK